MPELGRAPISLAPSHTLDPPQPTDRSGLRAGVVGPSKREEKRTASPEKPRVLHQNPAVRVLETKRSGHTGPARWMPRQAGLSPRSLQATPPRASLPWLQGAPGAARSHPPRSQAHKEGWACQHAGPPHVPLTVHWHARAHTRACMWAHDPFQKHKAGPWL